MASIRTPVQTLPSRTYYHVICVLSLLFLVEYAQGQGPGGGRIVLEIAEGLRVGYVVGTIPTEQGFTYTFNENNPYFSLNSNSGTITTSVILDRESLPQNRIDLLIVGRQISQPSYPIEVSVQILDLNDNAPQFSTSSISVSIPENAQKGTQTLIDTATDPDEGKNGTVGNYRIIAGNEDGKFILVEPQQLSPYMYIENSESLDRELQGFYQLRIAADDGGNPPKVGYLVINITVQDVNDNPPIFDHSDYTASINESAAAGTSVIKVHATDRDKGLNSDITYSITDETDQFTIDTETGDISNTVNADQLVCHRECQRSVISPCHARSCFITVEAHDRGTPSLTGRAYISVNLIDENDHAPMISFTHKPDNSKTFSAVNENVGLPQVVAIVSVVDADQGLNGQTMLSIASGNEEGHFKVIRRGSFNLIQVSGRLDRERTSMYNLTMLATDKGSPAKSSTAHLIIYVNDVNDHAPEFQRLSYTQTLSELVPIGSFVASVVATDMDSGVNAEVTYAILSGDQYGWFKIDESTGLVITAKNLDYELSSRLILNISATDGAISPHRNFTSLAVELLDENDMVPTFTQSVLNVNITEGVQSPVHLATLTAEDNDSGENGTVQYFLDQSVEDQYPGTFKLVTGTSRIETMKTLDRELFPKYTVYLVAKDSGRPALSSTATINLRVLDINDNSPVFYPDQYYARVFENQPVMSPVVSIDCRDKDEGLNGEVIFSISQGDTQTFAINSSTGLISTLVQLNREQRSSYTLTITATDNGEMKRSTDTSALVQIIVADENDEVPVFTDEPYDFHIVEDGDHLQTRVGRKVGTVKATTRDTVGITYSIVDGDPNNVFTINSMSGEITTRDKVDRERNSLYKLSVVATGGVMFNSANVMISVEDVNDNPPVFPSESLNVDVRESVGIGFHVCLAKALDTDEGPNSLVSYTLQSESANTFSIKPDSGIIYVSKPLLDISVRNVYSMIVTASDAGTPSRAASMRVNINVQDVNDHTPTFPYQNYEVSLVESSPLNEMFFNLTATDGDFNLNSQIVYNITRGNDGGSFGIFPNGILYVAHQLDRETRDFYRLTVAASDRGDPPRSSSMNITIHILDDNDNRPLFLNSTYNLFVEESAQARTLIGSVSANDNDVGRNAEISYSLAEESNNFTINLHTGEIFTLVTFDREELIQTSGKDYISFEVVGTDNGLKRLEDQATVNVYISDVNDNAPVFSKPLYSIPLHEQAPVNSQVLKVSAVDLDSGLNSYISYSLLSGDGLDKFSIDSASGVIILTSRIDRETKDLYHLTVLASDNGKLTQNSATASVRISILDDNDNFPQFVQTLLETHLLETTPPGQVITQFVASDSDIANNAVVSYTITSGNALETFSLDFNTGKLYLDKPLDFETRQNFALNITAEDFGSPRLSSYIRFIVNVDDFNDNAPVFPPGPIMREVTEGPSVQSPVVKVTATDADSGINKDITYSIISQDPYGDHFRIDSRSGMIYINSEIDREFSDQFNLTILATDQAEPAKNRKSAQKSVLIMVKDRNDNVPEFVSMSAVGITPNSPSSTQVMTITATDADINKNGLVRYRLVTADRSLFALDSESGLLYLSSSLPPQPLVHEVTVRAEDQGVQDTLGQKHSNVKIAVFVKSSSENGPTFTQASFAGHVYENQAENTYILSVSATSSTSSQVKYYITGIESSGIGQPQYFKIDEDSGKISTTKPLDRENGVSFFDVEVYAVEINGSGPKTRSVQVQIELKDENDSPPTFSRSIYQVTVTETQILGTSVVLVEAEDRDVQGQMALSISSGNQNGIFRIDENGLITNVKVLDREAEADYYLTVRASDSIQETFVSVNIKLTDVNDHAPHFAKNTMSFDIPEDTPLSTTVASVLATDSDEGENSHVTYKLASDWGMDIFQLHPTRGTFTLIGQLDFEQVQHYILTVEASDNGQPSLSSNITLYMNILDANDNGPIFDPMSYEGEVWENTSIGTSILTVVATDVDSGTNSEISYYIFSGDLNGDLTLDDKSGVIRTAKSLDRERLATYTLLVMAMDNSPSQRFNTTAQVVIHVRDVNDEAPMFISANTAWIKENSVIGQDLFTVSATDKDFGPNAEVEYTLLTSDSPFTIGLTDGNLKARQVIDREVSSEYMLMIEAKDKGSLSSTQQLRVIIEDVNDNNPRFDPRLYQKTVSEDIGVGTSLLQVTANDNDQGFNGIVRYFIIQGDNNRDFNMDHSSGTLRVQKSLDYERKSLYVLMIQAEDSGISVRYDTATVTISITDVNDNAPVFFHSPYYAYVQENLDSLPVHVTSVSAFDEDSQLNSQVTYTLREGDRNKFRVDKSSGEVTVLKTLDRETISEYQLVVIATDSAGSVVEGTPPLTGTGTINVIVQDDNDNMPIFQHQHYFGSVLENLDKYSPVLTVKALDDDEGMNADIRYRLLDSIDSKFTINPTSGTIITMTSLDREERDQYRLTVIATDGGFDPNSATTQVTIAVDDANDNQPHFETPNYSQNILDPTEPGTFVLGVTAVDRDSGPNGKIQYRLQGAGATDFNLDPNNGILTAKSSLTGRSAGRTYQFKIIATDMADHPHSAEASVTIQFSGGSPSTRPRFTSQSITPLLSELSTIGHSVTTVSAVSTRSSVINYFIAGGNIGQAFAVNRQSGVVSIAKELDYELTVNYNLWIEARDLGNPIVSNYHRLTIDVQDENDNIPRFDQQYYNVSITEDRGDRSSNLRRLVVKVSATDQDSGDNRKIAYSLSAGNTGNAFSINTNTGEIKTNNKIDRETIAYYSLQVTAVDQGSTPLTASASVDVYIEDLNDNPPQFTRQSAVSIPENIEIGTFILRATSTDNDIGENARVIYSLGQNPNEMFRIDPSSGNITVNGHVDAEEKNIYNIEVVATDLAYRPSTPVTITIEDVNDNAPVFNKSVFDFNFNEGQANNAFVGQVHAKDGDITSPNNQFYFSLERPSSFFHLDTNMGNIYSLKTLEFVPPYKGPSSANRYELDIVATDLGVPPKVSKAKVVVNVLDANDHAPVFTQTEYFLAVEENVPAKEIILYLNATDSMDYGVNAEVLYFKDGGNGSTLFDVNAQTGALSVSRSLSGLRNRILYVTVKAQDKGIHPKSSYAHVYFIVTDINRNSPKFVTATLESSLSEVVPPGTLIATLEAEDKDSGINGEIRYSITGGNHNHLFTIDEKSGKLIVANLLDFDSVPIHYINITAKDRAFRHRQSSVVYTLKLTDVNDNPPVFNQSHYDAKIKENSPNGSWVFRAHATDRDSGTNAAVEYSIISDTDARTMFTIESRSGIIRLYGNLNYEIRKKYTMTVLARNPSVDNLRNTTTITVHVTGQNEFTPHFRRSSYDFMTSKSAGIGTPVGSVSATDNDDGQDGIIYYFLVGVSNLQGFEINMMSGDLSVASSLVQAQPLVTLTVLAKNRGSIHGNDTDQCEVRVRVEESASQPCGDYYCQNGGQCRMTDGDTICECPDTWTGPSCSRDIDECLDSPCKNGGTCHNTDGSFYCECPDDTGDLCDGTQNYCNDPNPCLNGATCEMLNDSYFCNCAYGYWGTECEKQSFNFVENSFLEGSSLDAYQNHITLYFATVQTDALLLFNPGKTDTDFIAVEIIAGKVRFSFALSNSATPTQLHVPVRVSDGGWYKVEVTRGQQTSSLKVTSCPKSVMECESCNNGDSRCHTTALSAGLFNAGSNKLLIGGVKNFDDVLRRAGKVETFNFIGCMKSVLIEGQDVLQPPYISREVFEVLPGCRRGSASGQCSVESCSRRGECIDEWSSYRCACSRGYSGESCEKEWTPVSFGSNTVVSYSINEAYRKQQLLSEAIDGSRRRRSVNQRSLSVSFLTTKSSGVLIYTAGKQNFGLLQVLDKNVVFRYKLPGLGIESLVAGDVDVTTGEWHEAVITLTGPQLELSVDGVTKNTSNLQGTYDLTGSDLTDLSVGGSPTDFTIQGQTLTGFVGCIEEFLLDGEVLPFTGHTERFTIEVNGAATSNNCPGVVAPTSNEDKGLTTGIIVVIVFFIILIIVIVIVFAVFRYRRGLCWKVKEADGTRAKQNGTQPKHGNDTGGNRSQDSGYSGDNPEMPDEMIIRNHITEQLTLTQSRNKSGISRPDIIDSERRSTIPMPLEIDDGTVIIENGDLSHIHHQDVPEHYDLENASSIAPSDIDVVTHYKGFRDGKVHKYKTNPHVPNYHKNQQPRPPSASRSSPVAHSGRSSALSRGSPGPISHSPVGIRDPGSVRNSPLAMNNLARNSPAPQSARATPLNHMSRPNIASSPLGYSLNSRGTPISSRGRRTDSEGSVSSASTGRHRGPHPRGHRGNKPPDPYRAYPGKPAPFKGLTVEEVDRLNARPRGNSPISMLDAVSSTSDDNVMLSRKAPETLLLEAPDSTTDDSANDSFTCSEFEYDNDKVRNDPSMMIFSKLTEVENEVDELVSDSRPLGHDGRDSRGDSYSTLPSSEEDRFQPHKPLNGNFNWDYLLNWGPSFEKLVGVFKDIALLPDGECTADSQNLSPSSKTDQEEYV